MKVTPRKNEVEAVLALMESDEFDSGAAMAKAIIKKVGELFAERDWYAWVWRENQDAFQLASGPYSSPTEVDRVVKKVGLTGQHMALHIYPSAPLNRRLTEMPSSMYCSGCGHPDHAHEVPKYNGRCWIKRCGCKKLDKSVAYRDDV